MYYGGGDKSSAEGASVEAPQAPRDVHGRCSPTPSAPPHNFFLHFHVENVRHLAEFTIFYIGIRESKG